MVGAGSSGGDRHPSSIDVAKTLASLSGPHVVSLLANNNDAGGARRNESVQDSPRPSDWRNRSSLQLQLDRMQQHVPVSSETVEAHNSVPAEEPTPEHQQSNDANAAASCGKIGLPVRSIAQILDDARSSRGPDVFKARLYTTDGVSEQWIDKEIGVADLIFHDRQFHILFKTDPTIDPNVAGETTCVNMPVYQAQSLSRSGKVITWNWESGPCAMSFSNVEGAAALWTCLIILVPDKVVEDNEEEAADESSLQNSSNDELEDSVFPSGLSAGYSIYSPPHTAEAVTAAIAHVRHIGQRRGVQHVVMEYLSVMTGQDWLDGLFSVLKNSMREGKVEVCGEIADLLCLMVALYAASSNPFAKLALSPEAGQKYLDPDDSLVRLLSDANYINFFRAMQFESELRKHNMRIDHVEFLRDVHHRSVVCKEDDAFKVTSDFIYRLLYLRDVCLPRHLDELTILRLTSIANAGYAYVCRLIQLTPGTVRELRNLIPNDIAASRFLLSLLTVLRTNVVAVVEKTNIYNALKQEQVLRTFEVYLTGQCLAISQWEFARMELLARQKEAQERMVQMIQDDPERKHRPKLLSHDRMSIPTIEELVVDIFGFAAEQNPSLLRHAFLTAVNLNGAPTLWLALCNLFRSSDNGGLHIQLVEIFKKVLDPLLLYDDVCSLFYDKGVIDKLIDTVLDSGPQTFEDLVPSTSNQQRYFIPEEAFEPQDFRRHFCSEGSDAAPSPMGGHDDSFTPPSRGQQSPIPEGASQGLTGDETDENGTPTAGEMTGRPAKRRASAGPSGDRPVAVLVSETDSSQSQSGDSNESLFRRARWSTSVDSDMGPARLQPSRPRRLREDLSESEKQAILKSSVDQFVSARCHICDLLIFCVRHHPQRMKYRSFQRLLHIRLIEGACQPQYSPFLALYAVKFLKACLSAEEDHYARLFRKHDVFQPILQILLNLVPKPKGRGEGSLVESSILDFFLLIYNKSFGAQMPSMAALLRFLVEHHPSELSTLASRYSAVSRFDLFERIHAQYKQQRKHTRRWSNSSLESASKDFAEDREATPEASKESSWDGLGGRRRRHPIDEAERERLDEELYFESDAGEDETEGIADAQQEPLFPLAGLTGVGGEAFKFKTFADSPLPILGPHQTEEDDETDVPDFLKQPSPRRSLGIAESD